MERFREVDGSDSFQVEPPSQDDKDTYVGNIVDIHGKLDQQSMFFLNERLGFDYFPMKRGVTDWLVRKMVKQKPKKNTLSESMESLGHLGPFLNKYFMTPEKRNRIEWNGVFIVADHCLSHLDWGSNNEWDWLQSFEVKTRAIIQTVISMKLLSSGNQHEAQKVLEWGNSEIEGDVKGLLDFSTLTNKAYSKDLSGIKVQSSLPTWFERKSGRAGFLSDMLFRKLIDYWPDAWIDDLAQICFEHDVLDDGFNAALCHSVLYSAMKRVDKESSLKAISRCRDSELDSYSYYSKDFMKVRKSLEEENMTGDGWALLN